MQALAEDGHDAGSGAQIYQLAPGSMSCWASLAAWLGVHDRHVLVEGVLPTRVTGERTAVRQFRLDTWEHSVVYRLAFAPTGDRLYALVDGGWEHDRLSELHELSLPAAREDRVSFVRWAGVFGPDARWVASVGHQDTAGVDYLVVHDLTANPTREPPPDPEIARALGITPEPIFSRLWSYPNVSLEPCLLGLLKGTLAVSADGRLLAGSATEDHEGWGAPDELWVWDVGTWAYRRTEVPARPDALAFSPDGRWLFGARSRGLDRWDVATLSRRTWRRWSGRVSSLRFSPDGAILAAAVGDAVVLLNVQDPEVPAVRSRLPVAAVDLVFHPDGQLLTAGREGEVRIWDPTSGRELAALDWSAGPLHSLAIAPGGQTAAAGGENGQIVVWDVDG